VTVLAAALASCREGEHSPGDAGAAKAPSADTSTADAPMPNDPDAPVKLVSAGYNPDTGYVEAVLEGPASTTVYKIDAERLQGSKGGAAVELDATGRGVVVLRGNGQHRFGIWVGEYDALKGAQVSGKAERGEFVLLEAKTTPRLRPNKIGAMLCPDGTGPCSVRYEHGKGWTVSGGDGLSFRVGAWTIAASPEAKTVASDDLALLSGLDLTRLAGKHGDFDGTIQLPIAALDGDTVLAEGFVSLLSTQFRGLLTQAVKEVRSGPVAASPEGSGTAALWIDGPDGPTDPYVHLIGEAKGLGDVAILVLSKRVAGKKISCGTYGAGGESTSVTVQAWGAEMTAYERKTGRELGKKSFSPPARCPKSVSSRSSEAAVSTGAWVEDELIIAWIDTLK
jgi:hypothetical protein